MQMIDQAPAARTAVGVTAYGCSEVEASLLRAAAERLGMEPTIVAVPVTQANAGLARGSRTISVSHRSPIGGATLRALRRAGVEYISTRSIGCNHIDVELAADLGIRVGNVDYSPDSVGDYTLMLMLMAVRHTKSVVLRADAQDYRLSAVPGRELRDLTVGVVGTGRIGGAVIERLRGFGCRVLAHDRQPRLDADYVGLDDLLRHSDIVTLHTPLTTDTRHLLDRRAIEQMKRGAYVVNTGRGPLLDTEALLAALESGALAGAALDVVEGEEGIFYADRTDRTDEVPENEALARLQRMPNVLISPHCAYYTDHALKDTVESSLVHCLGFERGTTT